MRTKLTKRKPILNARDIGQKIFGPCLFQISTCAESERLCLSSPSQAAYCSPADSRRFNLKPGMAGWAWIHGRNRLPWDERVRLDLWYVDHWSLGLDFYILAKAFVLLFLREGVYGAEGGDRSPETQTDKSP